ncbi:MAG TPA: glycoside hydrolase family 71/99-like protein [Verrucomicrobiae bacterium]|nr:glycoside hydrolase family 71/99-like protein [Verrucomicrobiae bacterium]
MRKCCGRFVVLFFLCTAVFAKAQLTATTWNPAGNPTQPSDNLWTTPGNWSGRIVPTHGSKAYFNAGAATCIVNSTVGGCQLSIGDGGPGGILIITNGGNLSAGDNLAGNNDDYAWTAIGYSSTAEMDIENGGSVTFNYHLLIGLTPGGVGTLIMNGGTASVAGAFGLGFSGGTGIVHMNGGTLTLSQFAANSIQGSGSVLDIGAGSVVIAGNQVASVNGFIASNKITGYGGTGTVACSYNGSANATTITATKSSSGSTNNSLSIQLSTPNLIVSWPTSSVYSGLQSTTNLIAPIVWQSLTNTVVATNGTNEVTLPLSSQTTFFSLNQGVDATTMYGKLLMGYQGWFACPNDGSAPNQWWHWFHNQTPTAANVNTDFLPDTSEFGSNELFNTQMTYSNGTPVQFYSSAVPQSVLRHFQWMQQNQLDGVFLQRFLTDLSSPQFYSFRNQVTANVRAGAEAYGRVFAIMYDVSGQPTNTLVSNITNDWLYLANTMHVTNSTRYLCHKGKPVVAIWGFGFNDGNHLASPQQAQTVINWFKSQGVTVMGGVPTYWRTLQNDSYTNAAWTPVYLSFDVISPWAVGRFGDNSGADNYTANITIPDLAECKTNAVDYMPVVFPGFSWFNENGGPLNQIPRNGGSFYWRQVYDAVHARCNMIYGAMFDEVNEGTAMYKLVPTTAQLPAQGQFLALDADGITLNSDWYLRLANQAGKMLRGEIPLQTTIPISAP